MLPCPGHFLIPSSTILPSLICIQHLLPLNWVTANRSRTNHLLALLSLHRGGILVPDVVVRVLVRGFIIRMFFIWNFPYFRISRGRVAKGYSLFLRVCILPYGWVKEPVPCQIIEYQKRLTTLLINNIKIQSTAMIFNILLFLCHLI